MQSFATVGGWKRTDLALLSSTVVYDERINSSVQRCQLLADAISADHKAENARPTLGNKLVCI